MSRDPDDVARTRFLALAAVRIGGALLVMFGIVVASGNAAAPPPLGWAMVVAGFLVLGVVTRRLARRWRSPDDRRSPDDHRSPPDPQISRDPGRPHDPPGPR